MSQIIDIGNGKLEYSLSGKEVIITACMDACGALTVPAVIEALPVCIIGKKAFFNQKGVTEIALPGTVKEIEGWAFSACSSLKRIYIPKVAGYIRTDTFVKSESLERIYIYEGALPPKGNVSDRDTLATLLAIDVTVFKDYSLIREFDTGHPEAFLAEWDKKARAYMEKDDLHDFTPFPAGGEEDYVANDNNEHYHGRMKRMGKVKLSFIRLLHDISLSDEMREYYVNYLLGHNIGCGTEETWEYIKECRENTLHTYELYIKIGGITADNIEKAISSLTEKHTELKAYLLRHRSKMNSIRDMDYFDSLLL